MNVYTYEPEELGFEEFPLGTCRLVGDDVIQVRNPSAADVFVVPPILKHLDTWDIVPFLEGNETKHVCLNIFENMTKNTPLGVLAFRCECTKKLLKRNPSTIAWPWPVKDIRDEVIEDSTLPCDISFYGWKSSDLCEFALQSIERSSLTYNIKRGEKFWGYIPVEERPPLRRGFVDAMKNSRLILSVRSHQEGVVRYRFWEAMAMGRVIIHVNDGCVYSLADRIDYERFVVRVPQSETAQVGEIAEEYLSTHTPLEIHESGQYARRMWERWLDSRRWPEIMTEIVREKIK